VFERAQTDYLVRRVCARINWCNFHYIKSTVIYFWETLLRDDTIFTVHLHRLRRPVATVEGKYGIFRVSTYYHSNSFWCSFSILAYSTALRRRRAREIAPSYWLRIYVRLMNPGVVLKLLATFFTFSILQFLVNGVPLGTDRVVPQTQAHAREGFRRRRRCLGL